jgi:hypothetical protein
MEEACGYVDRCSFYEAYHPSQNPADCELIASYCHGEELPKCQIRRYLQAQNQPLVVSGGATVAAG